jgi:hypothetical protein
MDNTKLKLTSEQENLLRQAHDELRVAQLATRDAYKFICRALDLEEDAGQTRKLAHHAAQVDTITADIGRANHALVERYMGVFEPDCICGMSSRCKLHNKS